MVFPFKLNLASKNGFTLIELLVVISIIGVLSGMVLVAMTGARERARDARRVSDMRQIITALQVYNVQYGGFPPISSDACCDGWNQGPCNGGNNNAFIGALATAGLLKQVPTDPKGGSGTGCYGIDIPRETGVAMRRAAHFLFWGSPIWKPASGRIRPVPGGAVRIAIGKASLNGWPARLKNNLEFTLCTKKQHWKTG
jgi:prepilin-type N-terminal cleavage/methylation domain-containing protein